MIRRNVISQARHLSNWPHTLRVASIYRPQSQLSAKLPAPTRARIISRWYSEKAATEAEESRDGPISESDAAQPVKALSAEESTKLQTEADQAKREVIDLKDKYLRQVAEYRNLQERTKRDMQQAKDFAIQKFARDLIESVDNLDRALTMVEAEKLTEPASDNTPDTHKELRQLHGGLKMTEGILMSTLKKHGLERFDPSEKGEKFDPNIHEATFQTPQPDKEDGTCFYTQQKGFILNGRIIRPAKVGVVKNS